jgi:signal transduction histidine kinase
MATIRARLAVGYAAVLGVTIVVFAIITYAVQGSGPYGDLDVRVRVESDLIVGVLSEAYRARSTVVQQVDTLGQLALTPDVAALLEAVRGYVVVLGYGTRPLYVSQEARALSFTRVQALMDLGRDPGSLGHLHFANLGPPIGRVRYFARPITNAGDQVRAVVASVPTLGFVPLITAMLWTAPFVIAASLLAGFLLVGRTLRPVEGIIDEIEAITDGRSLHRRLVTADSHDELARLTTTLNEMLARLERNFTALRRFTADASHELKTPLSVLRAGIERSLTHPRTNPEVFELLEETLIEVNRMAELVDSLLTLARADEGRAPLHLDDVDLRAVLAEVQETAGLLGEQAQVAVDVAVPDAPVHMRADHSRIRQLLMNLLTNAIKYTPAGGSVTVEWGVDDGRVALRVRDTGIGIAPGDLPHIFDRFWRADPARSRTGARPGAGLGLAISKWIAEAHGGAIEVQSRPGRGTTFTVTLPRAIEEESEESGEGA